LARARRKRPPGGWRKRHIWDRPGWQICPMRRSWRERGMRPSPQHPAPSVKPDLIVESPYAPNTIPPAACPLQARQPNAPTQPASASRLEDIATRTRRKWGRVHWGGESMVACCVIGLTTQLLTCHYASPGRCWPVGTEESNMSKPGLEARHRDRMAKSATSTATPWSVPYAKFTEGFAAGYPEPQRLAKCCSSSTRRRSANCGVITRPDI